MNSMNDRMEQEINRTIDLLLASMPRKKSGAALSVLIKTAKSEMDPLLLLALFLLSVPAGLVITRLTSPMITVFCVSPMPALILFHRYVLRSEPSMRELEETLPFSYPEMLAGRAVWISLYMAAVFLTLAALLSSATGEDFVRLALCGAVPNIYLCTALLLLAAYVRDQDGLSLAAIILWAGIVYCALVLPFDSFLLRFPTWGYGAALAAGAALYGLSVYKIRKWRFFYAVDNS